MTCISWLVAVTALLGIAGFGGIGLGAILHPTDPSQPTSGGTGSTTQANGIQQTLCALFLTPISLINFGSGSLCNKLAATAIAVYDTVDHLVVAVVGFFSILFQLNAMTIPGIPAFLQAMIVWPPEITLGYIGLKGFRGTGG